MSDRKTPFLPLFQSLKAGFQVLQSVVEDTVRISRQSELPLVASALAYTTLLSIIPALAVSFSIFKAFGGLDKLYESLEPLIVSSLAENSGHHAMSAVRGFISNARAGAIGAGGLLGLLLTTMSMVRSVDQAIHRVWGLQNRKDWFQRITQYWFFVTLGPLGLSLAVGYLSTLAAGEGKAVLQHLPGGSGLFLVVAACLLFLYKGVPTCKVRWAPAITAAIMGSALWNLARWGYTLYTTKAVTYDKIYGGLSAVPILLLWIYIVWLVTLLGAALSAALQKRTPSVNQKLPASSVVPAILVAVLMSATSSEARTERRVGAKKGTKTTAAKAQEKDPRDRDFWYTVTVQKGFHYAYYNDRIEYRDGKIHFLNQYWKNEEGYINQESLGGIAKDDAQLTPVFYHFRSAYRTHETLIDGSVDESSRWVNVKIRKNGTELPTVRRSLSPMTILSMHFPLWLGKNLMEFSEQKLTSFRALIEDSQELGFGSIPGTVRRLPPDSFAIEKNAVLLAVDHRDTETRWWVDAQGFPLRIEMPRIQTVVERVLRKTAETFFDAPAGTGGTTPEKSQEVRKQ
jgi:YihY family inner membrane protein